MIRRHITLIVFFLTVSLSLASIIYLLAEEDWALALTALSASVNVGAVLQSERGGFVRTNQMRRAYEPPRHFNGIQVMTLLLLVMLQVSVGVYVVLT